VTLTAEPSLLDIAVRVPPTALTQLDALESEAIHIMREVAAEFERPALLFSGGKDSVVLVHLAVKAFWPAPLPFPLLHVDTGHNFPEAMDFRDRRVAELDVRLLVANVQDSIDSGRVSERPGQSRNGMQSVTLLDAIAEHRLDVLFGGGRRDEEKARAKERVLSFRDEFGQWDPKNQRPELWNLYNGRHRPGEHIRAFPISNWTELDIWAYIERERLEVPELYYAHERDVVERDGMLLAVTPVTPPREGEQVTRLHRRGGEHRGHARAGARGDRRVHPHRAGRHPRGRPGQRGGHGGPQAGGLLLMLSLATD